MRPVRQNGVARRETLLDAALECFERRGLLRTGIEDVRKAARASPSSVYHLFPDFPALIAALLERTFTRLISHITARVLANKTPRTAVRALVEAHLMWVFEHESEARFMYQAVALELDGHHRTALLATKLRLKAELMTHLRKLGVFSGTSWPEAMADVVLLGPAHQACRAYLAAPDNTARAWMQATLPELAWRSARTKP